MKNKTLLLIIVVIGITTCLKAQIPSYLPSNGLIGWWPFNNNANDESNNGNNGSLLNGVAATTDRFGNTNSAYSFDGVNDRIYVNTSFFNAGWNEYTISGWVFLNTITNPSNPNSSHIFLNTSPHQGIGYGLNWGNSSKYYLFLGNGTSWNALFNGTSTQNIVAGTWQFTTLTKNANTIKLYVNGVLDKTWATTSTVPSSFYKIYFGGTDPLAANEIINGKLDDIGIWNRELTLIEITNVYTGNNVGIKEQNLQTQITISPNPTNGILNIGSSLKNPTVKIEIVDALGKALVTENYKEFSQTSIDISNLSSGIYFVKLISGNDILVKKIIKE